MKSLVYYRFYYKLLHSFDTVFLLRNNFSASEMPFPSWGNFHRVYSLFPRFFLEIQNSWSLPWCIWSHCDCLLNPQTTVRYSPWWCWNFSHLLSHRNISKLPGTFSSLCCTENCFDIPKPDYYWVLQFRLRSFAFCGFDKISDNFFLNFWNHYFENEPLPNHCKPAPTKQNLAIFPLPKWLFCRN